MKVLLPSLGKAVSTAAEFTSLAAKDRFGVHAVTEDAESADLILFTECHLLSHEPGLPSVRRHPLRLAFPSKFLVYDERDLPSLALPGIFVSHSARHFDDKRQRAWGYHTTPDRPSTSEAVLLFSFMGSASHPVREQIFQLQHPRAQIERVTGFLFFDATSHDYQARRTLFRQSLEQSKFVLCPRGKGLSSIRQYETLAAGRVPVIISDDWKPPAGPDWQRFSIRWPEGRISELPAYLESRESEFEDMAKKARGAYEEFFSPDVAFHRIVELGGELIGSGATSGFPRGGLHGRPWVDAYRDHLVWCGRNHGRDAARRGRALVRQFIQPS